MPDPLKSTWSINLGKSTVPKPVVEKEKERCNCGSYQCWECGNMGEPPTNTFTGPCDCGSYQCPVCGNMWVVKKNWFIKCLTVPLYFVKYKDSMSLGRYSHRYRRTSTQFSSQLDTILPSPKLDIELLVLDRDPTWKSIGPDNVEWNDKLREARRLHRIRIRGPDCSSCSKKWWIKTSGKCKECQETGTQCRHLISSKLCSDCISKLDKQRSKL